MRDKLFSAVHLLAALERSPEPMTAHELKGDLDDAAVLLLLLKAGYIGRHDDGRYVLNCDPAKLTLFELSELFGPYECCDERIFADLFEESLKEITVAWMIELEKPKPVTHRDIKMFQDCMCRIEQETGGQLPTRRIEDIVEVIA